MVVKVRNSSVRAFARLLLTLSTSSLVKPCYAPLRVFSQVNAVPVGTGAIGGGIGGGEVPSSILMGSERTANLDGEVTD